VSIPRIDRSSAPPPGPLRPFTFPPIERFRLDNGMEVVHARTEGPELATFSLLLPAGAAHEPGDRAGLASLTAALLESGAGGLDAEAIAERLETLGVRLQISAEWEVTGIDFTALVGRCGAAAKLTSEICTAPTFPDREVERLRAQKIAGIMQRRADPGSLANEMVHRYVFADESPFTRPLGGTQSTVEAITRSEVVGFHEGSYTPSGAGLIVAGNIGADEVRRIAETSFGGWRGSEARRVRPSSEPRADRVQVVLVEKPGAVQSEIRIGHVGVARGNPDYFRILVMNTILGGAFSSRLNLNLREKHGFTYGVSSRFLMRRQPGPFLVGTAVQTEVTGAAITETLREIEGIRDQHVRPEEIADARQYVAGTYPLRLETTDGVVARLAELFIHDLEEALLHEFPQRVMAVTEDQVLEAARKYLHSDRLVVLVVGDPERVRPQLEELRLGEIEIVPRERQS
jgi:zinc protease